MNKIEIDREQFNSIISILKDYEEPIGSTNLLYNYLLIEQQIDIVDVIASMFNDKVYFYDLKNDNDNKLFKIDYDLEEAQEITEELIEQIKEKYSYEIVLHDKNLQFFCIIE